MDNYPYIIASLPDLALDFEKHDFDYPFIRENIFFSLSQEDRRLVEWLEQGFGILPEVLETWDGWRVLFKGFFLMIR